VNVSENKDVDFSHCEQKLISLVTTVNYGIVTLCVSSSRSVFTTRELWWWRWCKRWPSLTVRSPSFRVGIFWSVQTSIISISMTVKFTDVFLW